MEDSYITHVLYSKIYKYTMCLCLSDKVFHFHVQLKLVFHSLDLGLIQTFGILSALYSHNQIKVYTEDTK